VSVSAKGSGTYLVEVRGGGALTSHTVEVPEGLAAELGWEEDRQEELVRESFAFLLAREPATSILDRFRLDVISRYFPEYKREIRRRWGER
jgi:hypothetical protein